MIKKNNFRVSFNYKMLDDEVTIMNEISRPPPPPPPAAETGRRQASHWDRQSRSNRYTTHAVYAHSLVSAGF